MHSYKRILVLFIFNFLPETRCFKFKRFLLQLLGYKIGKNVRMCSSVKILGNGYLEVGQDTWIGPHCLIVCSSRINIGENVDIGPQVYIGNGTHEIMTDSTRVAGLGLNLDVVIGDGSWIGVRSTILPGVEIGKMCMVAASSLVSKSTLDYTLVGGVPAKFIKALK